MIACASANSTSDKTQSIRPIRDPSIEPPARFERIEKEPGSKKLVLGKWVTVKAGDDDAAKRKRKGPRPVGPGGVGGPRDGAV